MGIYAADGSYNVTVVDGLSWVGLYAADGSFNIVPVDGTEPVGAYHPSGALNVYVTSSAVLKYRHPSGALYVSESPYQTGSTKITVVSGSLGTTAYEFGTLTLTGAGGITAPGGATISSSTIDGLELSGGYLVRKASGTVTTGTVTWSNGVTWDITAVTGYSFRSLAELQAIIALGVVTLSGKTAYGRYLGPGNYITWGGNNPLDSLTFTSTFTLTSHSGEGGNCRFKGQHWDAGVSKTGRISATTNLKLLNLEFFSTTDRRYTADYNPIGFNITGACDNITVEGCTFEGDLTTIGHGACVGGLSFSGITGTPTVTLTNNIFKNARRPLSIISPIKTLVAKGNEIYNFGVDGILAAGSPNVGDTQKWINNYVHDPLASIYRIRFEDSATPSYLKKTSELTGAADSKKFFMAFAVLNMRDPVAFPAVVGEDYVYSQGTNIACWRDVNGKYRFTAKDTGGSTVINMTSTNAYYWTNGGGVYIWCLISIDTDGTSRMHIWNEIDNTWTEEATATAAGQTLDLTAGAATIGADSAFANTCRFVEFGRVAVWHGIAPDVSSTTVRNYFVDPADMHKNTAFATARTALGNPIVDFAGTLAEWRAGTNKGTGGNFTEVGTLDAGHADLFQCVADSNVKGMICAGNVLIGFRSDATYESDDILQGLFLNDISTFSNAGLLSTSNIVVSNQVNGHNPHNVTDGYVLHNTLILPTDAIPSGQTEANTAPKLWASLQGVSVAPNNEVVADNIAYDTDLSGAVSSYELNSLDIRQANFAANFAGSGFTKSDLNTRTKVLAALRNKAGGGAATAVPQQGALPYGTDWFDWTNGDWWDDPRFNDATYSAPTDLTDQAISTVVESAAVQVTVKRNPDAANATNGAMVRVPAGVSVKILASDGTTLVTDWTTAGTGAIVGNGQYYKLRVTSNAANSATDNYTYWVGKVSDTWSVTTVAGAAPSFDIIPTDTAQVVSTLTTYTFSTKQLGTADAGRKIIVVCYFANGSSARTFSSGTINGQTATQFISVDGGAGAKTAFGIIADVPTGTSGDIVITMSGACANMSIDVFAAYGLASSTPTATATDTVDSSGVLNLNVNTLNNSLLVGLAAATTNATYTWAGATEYSDRANGTSAYISAAYQKITTGETPRTVTATGSTTLTDERSFVAVFQ